jgi:hypothetical protein
VIVTNPVLFIGVFCVLQDKTKTEINIRVINAFLIIGG